VGARNGFNFLPPPGCNNVMHYAMFVRFATSLGWFSCISSE
jgi:hypothetical protein